MTLGRSLVRFFGFIRLDCILLWMRCQYPPWAANTACEGAPATEYCSRQLALKGFLSWERVRRRKFATYGVDGTFRERNFGHLRSLESTRRQETRHLRNGLGVSQTKNTSSTGLGEGPQTEKLPSTGWVWRLVSEDVINGAETKFLDGKFAICGIAGLLHERRFRHQRSWDRARRRLVTCLRI